MRKLVKKILWFCDLDLVGREVYVSNESDMFILIVGSLHFVKRASIFGNDADVERFLIRRYLLAIKCIYGSAGL